MKTIDIDRELFDLMKSEELLAFFDFVLDLDAPAGGHAVEGLCKVSRPRKRDSRSTYLSVLLLVDAPDDVNQRAAESHLGAADWSDPGEIPGVDCVLSIPSRGATGGLLIKEVDVYLDGTREPDASYVRDVLTSAISRVGRLLPGELTVWEEAPKTPSQERAAPVAGGSLLDKARRMIGLSR